MALAPTQEYPGAAELRHAAVLAAVVAATAMLRGLEHWKQRLPASLPSSAT